MQQDPDVLLLDSLGASGWPLDICKCVKEQVDPKSHEAAGTFRKAGNKVCCAKVDAWV